MINSVYETVYALLFLFMAYYFCIKYKVLCSENAEHKFQYKNDMSGSGNTNFKDFTIDLILLCFLLAASIKFTFSIENIKDIFMCDESYYLNSGVILKEHGLPDASYGPLYALWYYVLSLFEKDNLQLYFLNYKVLVSSVTVLLYIYLRRIGMIPIISAMTLFVLFSSKIFAPSIPMSLLVLLIFLLFLILATFAKSTELYYAITGLGILLMSYVRPEYFLAFIIYCGIMAFYAISHLKTVFMKPVRYAVILLLFVSAAAALFCIFGIPVASMNRHWPAFAQAFYHNYRHWTKCSIADYRINDIKKLVFGEADSITGAFRNNPELFLRHIFHNAAGYIQKSVRICLIGKRWSGIFLNRFIKVSEVVSFITACVILLKNQARIRKVINRKAINHLYILTGVILLPAISASIVISSRMRHLTVQGTIIMLFFFYYVSALVQYAGAKKMGIATSLLVGALILILTPNRVSGWSSPVRYAELNRRELENQNIVRFIRSLDITKDVYMAEVSCGYFIYLKDNFHLNFAEGKDKNFYSFMEEKRINMVIVSEKMLKFSVYTNDREFTDFLRVYRHKGFVRLDVPMSKTYILLKQDLVKDSK